MGLFAGGTNESAETRWQNCDSAVAIENVTRLSKSRLHPEFLACKNQNLLGQNGRLIVSFFDGVQTVPASVLLENASINERRTRKRLEGICQNCTLFEEKKAS